MLPSRGVEQPRAAVAPRPSIRNTRGPQYVPEADMRNGGPTPRISVALLGAALCACSDGNGGAGGTAAGPERIDPDRIECSLPRDQIFDGGVGRDQIPALSDPALVAADHPDASFLVDTSRVVGLRLDGEPVAVPHAILWWHEIVNFGTASRPVVVTHCPLTGSSLVFDMRDAKVTKFIVSGLLFNANLMMVDEDSDSIWPQMTRQARCGPRDGDRLTMVPAVDVRWGAWKAMHPDTRVVSSATGFDRDYTRYPYGRYQAPDLPPFHPVADWDRSRPPKERVLGIPDGDGGLAFPFFELAEAGPVAAAHGRVGGEDVVALWSEEAGGGAIYRPVVDSGRLTFTGTDGRIEDRETGSAWSLDGRAVSGPLAGARLEPVAESYVAFWFAWSIFQPDTGVWSEPTSAGERARSGSSER